ncbi:hypothetical protein [Peribacillus aracenensis]|nr:hypothetical protein [Peribacillus sp. BBB004]
MAKKDFRFLCYPIIRAMKPRRTDQYILRRPPFCLVYAKMNAIHS